MVDKHRKLPDHSEITPDKKQHEAQTAHEKMLGESAIGKPPAKTTPPDSKTTTIEWPGGGKRTFERDKDGKIAKVTEKDGTYYERQFDIGFSFQHKRHEAVISSGQLSIDEKTRDLTYINEDDNTKTVFRSDGSSTVRKCVLGFGSKDGPFTELHNPPKADGTPGDVRKFTYDDKGHMSGYQVISANKNLCSNWKTTDGVNWRKVDEKGNDIKDADKEKDEKNILVGRMYISSDGVFAFDNQRKAPDESPHWTVVSQDGHRHERITNLDKPKLASAKPAEAADVKETLKATDTMRKLQMDLVKAHIDELKPNNPVGWVGLIGTEDLDKVIKDANKSADQKLVATILKRCMAIQGIGMIHTSEIDGKVFQGIFSQLSLDDIAYDQQKS